MVLARGDGSGTELQHTSNLGVAQPFDFTEMENRALDLGELPERPQKICPELRVFQDTVRPLRRFRSRRGLHSVIPFALDAFPDFAPAQMVERTGARSRKDKPRTRFVRRRSQAEEGILGQIARGIPVTQKRSQIAEDPGRVPLRQSGKRVRLRLQ